MRGEEIEQFVGEILGAGASLFAVGSDSYIFGDVDASGDEAKKIWEDVNIICERYGPRDHLRREIAAYLKDLGYIIDVDHECQTAPNKTIHTNRSSSLSN